MRLMVRVWADTVSVRCCQWPWMSGMTHRPASTWDRSGLHKLYSQF